jgi:hypothetical protein
MIDWLRAGPKFECTVMLVEAMNSYPVRLV